MKKVRLHLNTPAGAIHQALAMEDGVKKRSRYNFREKTVSFCNRIDAINRHLLALLDGQDFADDSGVHHLGHIMANCGILLDCIENGNLIDDRPIKGNASEILKRFEQNDETKT